MSRRIIVCFLLLAILSTASVCQAEQRHTSSESYLGGLGILSQLDPALEQARYMYCGHRFWESGCLPASITNALTAAFGVEELDTSELLHDVLVQMASQNRPDLYAIEPSRVASLFAGDLSGDSPALQQLSRSMTGIEAVKGRMSGKELVQRLTALGDSRVALIFTLNIRGDWERVLEITDALCDAGLPQARLVLCNLTVGVPGTSAPFHSSSMAGHYAALYFEAGEFHDTGAFYLLDSYPRALEGDSYGSDSELYQDCYPFVGSRQFQAFNSLYTVSHVTPTVVRLALHPDAQAALASPAGGPEARTALRLRQLKPVMFYGTTASTFLVLP